MWCAKYNANGNDFIIFHSFVRRDYSILAKKLCDRHSGIGADGLVVLLPSDKFAYEWDFYNADGSSADMCGNASRCVGHYALWQNLAESKHSFLSKAGEIKLRVENDLVEVDFGKVQLLQDKLDDTLLGEQLALLDSGVPHLVAFVENNQSLLDFTKPLSNPTNPNHANLKIPKLKIPNIKILRDLRHKYNANVNLAYIIDREHICLATYERGVEDITLACGTGAASVFYLALKKGLIETNATLIPPSGDELYMRFENKEVYFKGKVSKVCDIYIGDFFTKIIKGN